MSKSTVDIAVANTLARIRSVDNFAYHDVDKFLSFFSKTAPYHREYKRYLKDRDAARKAQREPRGWNGVKHLLKDDVFPAGLVGRVQEQLESEGYRVRIFDKRVAPVRHPKLLDGSIASTSREWQDGAFEAIQKHERGVIQAATGAGKTTVMAQNLAYLGQPSLVLVNRATLAKQTLARFESIIKFPHAKSPFGLIGDGVWEPGLITVATFQTLHSMLSSDKAGMRQWLKNFKAFHADECHHIPAETFADLIDETEECYWRYGYSATPFKNDKETELKLVGATGEQIFTYSAADAIADGILTPPKIYVVDANFPLLKKADPADDNKYQGKFIDEYKEGIVNHRERNHLLANIAELCAEHKIPTLLLVRQMDQGKSLEKLINDSEFLSGRDNTATREDAKKRLTTGELPVLIASTIFNEGEDIPAVGAGIIGGGYTAEHVSMQTVGRILRPSPGQKFALIFDVIDSHSHRLEKHSLSRIKTWRKEGFEVHVVTIDELERLMETKEFWGNAA